MTKLSSPATVVGIIDRAVLFSLRNKSCNVADRSARHTRKTEPCLIFLTFCRLLCSCGRVEVLFIVSILTIDIRGQWPVQLNPFLLYPSSQNDGKLDRSCRS